MPQAHVASCQTRKDRPRRSRRWVARAVQKLGRSRTPSLAASCDGTSLADKLGERFVGYVTSVTSFGLFVELEEYFVEGLVHISAMADDYYIFKEKTYTLKGESTGKVYRLGDRLDVRVARVDLERRRIDLAIESIGNIKKR
jgi:predicted RNA-binding protein with RPS1 domain